VGQERLDQTFGAKWISDVSLGFRARGANITVGADNVFDVYPDQNNDLGDARTGTVGVTGPAGPGGERELRHLPVQPDLAVRLQRAVRVHAGDARLLTARRAPSRWRPRPPRDGARVERGAYGG
jgi:hypothetical protein